LQVEQLIDSVAAAIDCRGSFRPAMLKRRWSALCVKSRLRLI